MTEESGASAVAEPATVEVDWEGLAVALENQLSDSASFFDRRSGRVVTVQLVERQDVRLPVEEGDWVTIPPRSSREGFRTMQRFLERLEDHGLRAQLAACLAGKGAFRRFKDALLAYPEVRDRWFAFKDLEVYSHAAQWLERVGVRPANHPPAVLSKDRIAAAARRSSASLIEPPHPGAPVEPAAPGLDWRAAIAPFDRPERRLRPERAALLLVDLQRVFVDPAGSSYLPSSAGLVPRLAALAEAFRRRGRPVFWTRHVHVDPAADGGALGRWWRSLIREGSWEAELADGLRPTPEDRVLTKCRYSAFCGTPLELNLRSLRVEELVIGGVMTELCCETTAREAFVRDFDVFFLADGTATAESGMQLASLRALAHGFGRVLGVDEVAASLEAGREWGG